MKIRRFAHRLLFIAFLWNLRVSQLVQAPESLTPPGALATTIKKLDEVEARTIVSIANCPAAFSYAYGITPAAFPNGGSVYRTGNLVIPSGSGGILIRASNVTLDLNGFSIVNAGGASTLSGVLVSGANVTVTGGTVSGGGFNVGVSSSAANTRVSGLSVSGTTRGRHQSFGGRRRRTRRCRQRRGRSGHQRRRRLRFYRHQHGFDRDQCEDGIERLRQQHQSEYSGHRRAGKTQNLVGLDTKIPIAGNSSGAVATYTISAPGSYYLTSNFTVSTGDGILLAALGVTLDLNGCTISSTATAPGSGNAFSFSGTRQNIAVQNVHISGGSPVSGGVLTPGKGFVHGISWPGSSPSNVRISGVSVVGVSGYAIDLGVD